SGTINRITEPITRRRRSHEVSRRVRTTVLKKELTMLEVSPIRTPRQRSRGIASAAAIYGAIVMILALSVPQGQSQNAFDGKSIFRFDTFGDEQLWTDTLQMQQAIKNVSPATALSVGLKVDADALPPALIS